jgi:signal peptidase I
VYLLGVDRRDDAGLLRIAAALVVGLIAVLILAAVVALTFSVRVDGDSMRPTLKSGDRLEIDLLHRHDVHRFDLVEAAEPQPGGPGPMIVKRVIGMPGDRVAVAGGPHPQVYLRPAGSTKVEIVDNPTWEGQVGAAIVSCCTASGTSLDAGGLPKKWVTVPAGDYWVVGDNWGGSTDSRVFGFVPAANVRARLSFRLLPWGRKGTIPSSVRLVPAKR